MGQPIEAGSSDKGWATLNPQETMYGYDWHWIVINFPSQSSE